MEQEKAEKVVEVKFNQNPMTTNGNTVIDQKLSPTSIPLPSAHPSSEPNSHQPSADPQAQIQHSSHAASPQHNIPGQPLHHHPGTITSSAAPHIPSHMPPAHAMPPQNPMMPPTQVPYQQYPPGSPQSVPLPPRPPHPAYGYPQQQGFHQPYPQYPPHPYYHQPYPQYPPAHMGRPHPYAHSAPPDGQQHPHSVLEGHAAPPLYGPPPENERPSPAEDLPVLSHSADPNSMDECRQDAKSDGSQDDKKERE